MVTVCPVLTFPNLSTTTFDTYMLMFQTQLVRSVFVLWLASYTCLLLLISVSPFLPISVAQLIPLFIIMVINIKTLRIYATAGCVEVAPCDEFEFRCPISTWQNPMYTWQCVMSTWRHPMLTCIRWWCANIAIRSEIQSSYSYIVYYLSITYNQCMAFNMHTEEKWQKNRLLSLA